MAFQKLLRNYSRRGKKFYIAGSLLLVFLSSIVYPLYAEDYTSTNFILRDPVITIEGGVSTSASFQYFSSTGQTSTGESTTPTFIHRAGFLYVPTTSSPIVSATGGNAQVSLSWTAAVGSLGVSVASYQVGQSTTSGGPYTFTSVGNVLSSTRTGLTNATRYYFVIRALDNLNNPLVTSAEVFATPSAPVLSPTPTPTPPPAGGGGGGGGYTPLSPSQTGVTFNGRAYPKSTITLLKDAQVAATTLAGSDAIFTISLKGLSGGNYIFSVYSEDNKGIRSSLLTFPVSVTSGATTNVSGIFLAPTIAVDKSEVKRGDNIAIFGQSSPNSEITISVNSDEEFFNKVKADGGGVYLYNFDTSPLALEQHFTKSKAALNGEISSFSKTISFNVGTKNIAMIPKKTILKGDSNNDGHVNLVDFSISAYWYRRPSPPASADLNGDGKVDLVDFSIMAFYWTG